MAAHPSLSTTLHGYLDAVDGLLGPLAGDEVGLRRKVELLPVAFLELARVHVTVESEVEPLVRRLASAADVRSTTTARLAATDDAMRALERVPADDPGFDPALSALRDAAREQRRALVALLDRVEQQLPADVSAATAEAMTPAAQHGPTRPRPHGLPAGVTSADPTWPRPGLTDELLAAFRREAGQRAAAASPQV